MADNGCKKSNGSWWARFRALPNDSPAKTVAITLAVALAGSALVAGSTVLLRPLQQANKEAERPAHIAEILRQLPEAAEIQLEARVVDLETGAYVPSMDPDQYDQRLAAKDPDRSVEIPEDQDIAGLGRRARFATIFLAQQAGETHLVILPVHGRGFSSTLYGYLGLSGNLDTVAGLTFYEHSETPGLGGLIDAPDWKSQWRGKKIWDGSVLMLGVGTGRMEPGMPEAKYQVDGLTGATWTGQGVTNLLHYWLGDHGYGPYLEKLKRRGG